MGETKVLDEAVKKYTESKASGENEEVIEILTEKFKNEIYKEVVEQEKERILEEVDREKESRNQQEQIEQIRWIVLETILLGILVGLLVNQGTDIIAYLKGDTTVNLNGTLYWVLFLVILNIAFVLFTYIGKLGDLFKKRLKK